MLTLSTVKDAPLCDRQTIAFCRHGLHSFVINQLAGTHEQERKRKRIYRHIYFYGIESFDQTIIQIRMTDLNFVHSHNKPRVK